MAPIRKLMGENKTPCRRVLCAALDECVEEGGTWAAPGFSPGPDKVPRDQFLPCFYGCRGTQGPGLLLRAGAEQYPPRTLLSDQGCKIPSLPPSACTGELGYGDSAGA